MGKKARERRFSALTRRVRVFDLIYQTKALDVLHPILDLAEVIEISSVARMLQGKTFPVTEPLRLPYPFLFFEWAQPLAPEADLYAPMGIVVIERDRDCADFDYVSEGLTKECEYVLYMYILFPVRGEFKLVCVGALGLDEGYCLIDSAAMPYIETDDDEIMYEELYSYAPSFVIYAIQMMNSSNVKLVDQYPSLKDNALWKSHTGKPLIKYKRIAITQKVKGAVEPNRHMLLDVMPLHLRRGNFAHYSDDAPLFGKYTGTFWRPATVVGNAKNGVVVKDYKVKPPVDE